MRLLCIADHVDPLIYSTGLKERYGKVDLVLSAGDLTLGYYDFIVSTLNRPLYFVFGNHHLEQRGHFGKPPDPFAAGGSTRALGRRCRGRSAWRGGWSACGAHARGPRGEHLVQRR